MPIWLKDLTGAWVFYTIIPKPKALKAQFKRIARFAPIIGIFIGLFQSLLWLLLHHLGWPKEAIILFVLCFGYWLTGGLHLDGLMDTADGIGAGKVKCLEAMRDSRIGASGIQAFILIVLLQISTLLKVGNIALFILPLATFWGRVAPLWAIEKFEYLQKTGTGSFHKENWLGYRKEIQPSFFILFLISIFLLFLPISINQLLRIIIFIFSGIFPAILIPHFIGKKLGGHTGDSYGACVVLVETFVLFIASLIL